MENTFTLELLIAFHATLRFVAVVAHDDFNGMALDAAVVVGVHREIPCRLGDLGRNEGIGLAEVEAEAELDRLLGLGERSCRA